VCCGKFLVFRCCLNHGRITKNNTIQNQKHISCFLVF
jgi:hypothetical protein